MKVAPGFIRFAAVCAFASVLTTLCVHLMPGAEVARTFDEQLALRTNAVYLARLWIIILHIIVVVASLWGIGLCRRHQAVGWLGIGFCGYLLFAGAELIRTSMALFTLNGVWRTRYVEEPAVRDVLRPLLEMWPGLNQSLFFLLILGFCLGNLFYGIALLGWTNRGRLDLLLGWLLLAWWLYGISTILHEYTPLRRLPDFPGWWAWTFQPAVRLFVGVWLWAEASPSELQANPWANSSSSGR